MTEQELDKAILLEEIKGNAKSSGIFTSHTMSVRLPVTHLMKVEELSHRADMSRNKMFRCLLELAFYEVEKDGPLVIRNELHQKYCGDDADIECLNEMEEEQA